jgi:uncharacterized integral membrane protein
MMQEHPFLNFRTVLKFETVVAVFIAILSFSFNVTGLAVSESSKVHAQGLSIFFICLGLIGLTGLIFTHRRK